MGDIYTEIDAQGHRRDIVDPESQRWINEFLRITGISRLKAAQVWSSVGKQMTPGDAAAQLGYAMHDDRLNMDGSRLAPPEDAAEQSNKQPPVSTAQWQGQRGTEIDDSLLSPYKGEDFININEHITVHDFGLLPNRSIGKGGRESTGWRVLEFARDRSDLVHIRIRGEFDRLEDAGEFLTVLRSNEVLEALASPPSANPHE